jgi:hypothetical protein
VSAPTTSQERALFTMRADVGHQAPVAQRVAIKAAEACDCAGYYRARDRWEEARNRLQLLNSRSCSIGSGGYWHETEAL